MDNQNTNIFDRLRAGVKLETLTERDCRIINELNETGNESIIVLCGNRDVQEQIDAAIPFHFVVNFEDGAANLNIFPDGDPSGKINFSSGFAVSELIILQWLRS